MLWLLLPLGLRGLVVIVRYTPFVITSRLWLGTMMMLLACGGSTKTGVSRPTRGGGSTVPVAMSSSSEPQTDVPKMRALLKRYSVRGHAVVDTYERLPSRWSFGGAGVDLRGDQGFGHYFRDQRPENIVRYMATAVHEMYHAYSSLAAYKLMADTGTPYGRGGMAVWLGETPLLVSFTPTFPAREIVPGFPASARTRRFPTYISRTPANQTTQSFGAYGLLDEWAAYHYSGLMYVDLWPWIRDEAPRNRQLLVDYVSSLNQVRVPYAELKLMLLHYLLYARSNHVQVYRALMANRGFRAAFIACDDAHRALIAAATRLEPTVHAFARTRGIQVELRNGRLTYNGRPSRVRDPAYAEVVRQLSTKPYTELEQQIRSKVALHTREPTVSLSRPSSATIRSPRNSFNIRASGSNSARSAMSEPNAASSNAMQITESRLLMISTGQ